MATFGIFGVAFIAILVLAAIPLRFPPEGGDRPDGLFPRTEPAQHRPRKCNHRAMLRTGTLYGFFLCYFTRFLTGLMALSVAKPAEIEGIGVFPLVSALAMARFAST